MDIAEYKRRANRIARASGYGRATTILTGSQNQVLEATPCGYRKNSTDEYVPNAYLKKGWSSCYYQHAACTVEIAVHEKNQGLTLAP